jgi:hypothetical protein
LGICCSIAAEESLISSQQTPLATTDVTVFNRFPGKFPGKKLAGCIWTMQQAVLQKIFRDTLSD